MLVGCWKSECLEVIVHRHLIRCLQLCQHLLRLLFSQVLRYALFLNRFGLRGEDLEFCEHLEDVLSLGCIQVFVVEYAHLAAQAELPEKRRDRQVDHPVVNDGLGDDGAAQSEHLVDLLYFCLIERLDAEWRWEEPAFLGGSPHREFLRGLGLAVGYFDLPCFELFGDVVVEFKSGTEAHSLLSFERVLKELPLVNLLDHCKSRCQQFIPLNDDLLPRYFLEIIV